MLPFMAPKKMTSLIMARRGKSPDLEVAPEVEAPGSKMNPALKTAAEDFLSAVDSRSPIDLAKAFQAAFDALESGEGTEEFEPAMDEGA